MKEPALDPGASRRPVLLAAAISAAVVALTLASPLFVHVGLEATADHRSDAELAPLEAIPAYSPET